MASSLRRSSRPPLAFQIIDYNSLDAITEAFSETGVEDPLEESYKYSPREYMIQLFGVTETSESVTVNVRGFQPYFYIRLPDRVTQGFLDAVDRIVRDGLRYQSRDYISNHLMKRESLYWFSNKKKWNFMQLVFRTERAFKSAKNIFLDKAGYPVPINIEGKTAKFPVYEANIDPVLRFIHTQEIEAAGWIKIAQSDLESDETCYRANTVHSYITEYTAVKPEKKDVVAKLSVACYDIECNSSHGDFPLAIKDYRKLAREICDANYRNPTDDQGQLARNVAEWIATAFDLDFYKCATNWQYVISRVFTKRRAKPNVDQFKTVIARIVNALRNNAGGKDQIDAVNNVLNERLPPLEGDEIICIGTTIRRDGITRDYVAYLGNCAPVADITIECFRTEKEMLMGWKKFIEREDPDILTGYNIYKFDDKYIFDRVRELDLEHEFMFLGRIPNLKSECQVLKLSSSAMGDNDFRIISTLGRVKIDLLAYIQRSTPLDNYSLDGVSAHFIKGKIEGITWIDHKHIRIATKDTAAVAVGNYITMMDSDGEKFENGAKFPVRHVEPGRSVTIYMGAHIDRSRWDAETEHNPLKTWNQSKDDVSAKEIFRLQRGSDEDRGIVAKYCVQDCRLVLDLMEKLEVINNSSAMANVCSVPFSFIFLRGQGIKLQSLVFKECRQNKQLVETLPGAGAAQSPGQKKDEDEDEDEDDEEEEGYEGAIVLEPKTGLYLEDPVSVLDYNSLYPSSMISENISHDTIVSIRDYDNEGNLVSMRGSEMLEDLDDYDYVDIDFDILKTDPEDKRKHPAKIAAGKRVCRYVQFKDGKKGTIPTILIKLLQARKDTRKRQAAYPEKSFMWMLLEALQLAFKVTANSLYGQIGASTSKIRFIELAASTTAFGRKLITYAKTSVEEYFGNTEFSAAEYVYGDTDSVFIKFRPKKPDGTFYVGEEALPKCIELGQMASKILSAALRAPHNLEYEKTFYPFCLLSKKRYVGHKYTTDTKKFDFTSMGIALKRRDYATVVKEVYRGAVDILMNEKDVESAVRFTRDYLDRLINGRIDIRKLTLTKSLRAEYANPMKIAHKVLAERIGERDPGNKPNSNDRISFVYIDCGDTPPKLQGDRIETPQFIKDNGLRPDYRFYITNQIMKPVSQLFATVLEKIPGYSFPPDHFQKIKDECYIQEKSRDKAFKRWEAMRMREVERLIFYDSLGITKTKANITLNRIMKQLGMIEEKPKATRTRTKKSASTPEAAETTAESADAIPVLKKTSARVRRKKEPVIFETEP